MKKKSVDEKKLSGNAGRRPVENPIEVEGIDVSYVKGMKKEEKWYWNLWAPGLAKIGKLNSMTLPDFLDFIKLKVRLNRVNKFIEKENKSLIQVTINVSASGVEHENIKESAYAKMSRDLSALVLKFAKEWGVSGGSGKFIGKPKSNPMDDFLSGK